MNKFNFLVASVLTLSSLLLPTMAMADDAKPAAISKHDKGTEAFKKADKDNDGTLDREEAKELPNVAKNFDAIDVDKDGTVDRDEVHNYMKNHKSK